MPAAIDAYAALNAGAGATQTKNDAGSADRFLKLLVAQMENQDPLNPMDNAQITSQMAQINTVNGIEQLNTTVKGLTAQFAQLQAVQGAALVGHDVTVQGNGLAVQGGLGVGGYELAGTARSVKVEILSPAGRVVDTLDLGAQAGGRHGFEWAAADLPDGAPYTFRVVATAGTLAVAHTPLMRDRVDAVRNGADGLTLDLARSGPHPYGDIKAFN